MRSHVTDPARGRRRRRLAASDVVLGAAVGTFAGLKVVRYHHSHPGNRLDDILLGVSAVLDGAGGWMLVGSRRF
jgi:hypothetical protein